MCVCLLTGNDHGQWMAFQELHKGEFIKRVKQLKAKQVSYTVISP